MAFVNSLYPAVGVPFLQGSPSIIGYKSASWREPFTPGFLRESTQARGTSRSLTGSGSASNRTFGQYKSNGDEIFCGFEAYRVRTWDTPSGSSVTTVSVNSSLVWSKTIEYTGTPSNNPSGPSYLVVTVRTATTETKTTPYAPGVAWVFTLSAPVTRGYLSSALNSWTLSASELGSADAAASSSESSEGLLVREARLAVRGVCSGFTDYGAWGMVGSLSARYNGKFTAGVVVEKRENFPVIMTSYDGSKINHTYTQTTGVSFSVELMESTEGLWSTNASDYDSEGRPTGVHEVGPWAFSGEGSDPRPLLEYAPMKPRVSTDLSPSYATAVYWWDMSMQAHSMMLVSRTGKQYKIHFEKYVTSYVGDTEVVTVTPFFDVETDPATLRVTASYVITAGEEYEEYYDEEYGDWNYRYINVRIGGIWVRKEDEWEKIASTDPAEELPAPFSLLSAVVTNTSAQLLVVRQSVGGSRFGFPPLDGSSGTYYRTRTVRFDEHNSPAGELGEDTCGGSGYPQGYRTIHYRDTHLHGSIQPREALADIAVLEGREYGDTWIPTGYDDGSGTLGVHAPYDTVTPTFLSKSWEADTIDGAWMVRWDSAPSLSYQYGVKGKLVSEEVISQGLSYSGSVSDPKNRAAWDYRNVPPGYTLRIRGQRLRHSVP